MVLECCCRNLHGGPRMVCLGRSSMAMVRWHLQTMVTGAGAHIALSVSAVSASARIVGGPP